MIKQFISQNILLYSINPLIQVEIFANSRKQLNLTKVSYAVLFDNAGNISDTPVNGGICTVTPYLVSKTGTSTLFSGDSISAMDINIEGIGSCSTGQTVNGNIPVSIYIRKFGSDEFNSSPTYHTSVKLTNGRTELSLSPTHLTSFKDLSGVYVSFDISNLYIPQ